MNLPTATGNVNGGGGGGAPVPGGGGDSHGPNDDYISAAIRLSPLVSTAFGGLLVAAGLAAV